MEIMAEIQVMPAKKQGGQSCGQHDWVHGFPELVKS